MGFWSTLGNIGKAALGFVPGGSIAAKALDAAGNIGDVAGNIAKGKGEGRLQEAQYGLQRDRLAMDNARANIDADSTRARQAMLLSLLGGMQDAQVTPPAHIAERMPTMSGGLKPSAMQGREEIVAAMRPRIMQALLTGQHMPGLTPTPQAGTFDKILSGVGTAGSLLGVFGPKATGIQPSAPPPQQPPVYAPNVVRGSGASFLPD